MATETKEATDNTDSTEERLGHLPTDMESQDLIALFVLHDVPNEVHSPSYHKLIPILTFPY